MRVHPKLIAYMQWTEEKWNDQETKDRRMSQSPWIKEKWNDQDDKDKAVNQNLLTREKWNDQDDKDKVVNHSPWIKEKLNDLVTKAGIRIAASLLVALSGLVLFTDKVTTFGITSSFGFQDTQTFIWALSQSFSPLILILGSCLRPYRIAYTIPGYIYFIQIYWVFHPDIRFDDVFLQVYAIGFVSAFTTLVIVINYLFQGERDQEVEYQSNLEHYLDLQSPVVKSAK